MWFGCVSERSRSGSLREATNLTRILVARSNGVLRYDTGKAPEFWLEVHIQQIIKSNVEPTSKEAKSSE